MEEKIINIIAENLGTAYVVGLVAIGLLIFVIWWARGVYERVRHIDRLPCDNHSGRIEEQNKRHEETEKSIIRIDTTLSFMQKSIDNLVNTQAYMQKSFEALANTQAFMQKSIDNLAQSLQGGQKGKPDPYTQAHSPLSLTPLGLEMVERTGLKDMLQKNWERIHVIIDEGAISKNPYDIQQYCLEQAVVFPEKFLDSEDLDLIKTDAFLKGLTLVPYMRAVAVLVRDRYFEENGIDVKEVDTSDPALKKKQD